MKLAITVSVSTDDGRIVQSSENMLQVATDLAGVDESVQKQDFLGQAENLLRTVGENQIPALYATVAEMQYAPVEGREIDATAVSTREPTREELEDEARKIVARNNKNVKVTQSTEAE